MIFFAKRRGNVILRRTLGLKETDRLLLLFIIKGRQYSVSYVMFNGKINKSVLNIEFSV